MLHKTGKNWLLNLHFPLQAAWLRQRGSAVSLCHLLFPLLALPQWHLAAPASPSPAETRPEPWVCWLRISREHPCVHTSHGAGFLGSFTVPLGPSTCVSAAQRGWEDKGTCEDVQHHHTQVQPQPTQIRALKLQTTQPSSSSVASHKWPFTFRNMD